MPRTLGILLAGGRGERLGLAVPKAMASFGGRTLLERSLGVLRELCDELVVSAPAPLVLPGALPRRVDDPPGAAGPLAGLVAAMRSAAFDRALVLGVDLPLLRAGVLGAIGARLGDALAVVPSPGGRAQPVAAWYSAAARGPLERAFERGERALVPAVMALPPLLLGDEALLELGGGPPAFLNINTPADLARAEHERARLERAGGAAA